MQIARLLLASIISFLSLIGVITGISLLVQTFFYDTDIFIHAIVFVSGLFLMGFCLVILYYMRMEIPLLWRGNSKWLDGA